ncbi:hypothetical protein ACR2WD_27765, partial [Klebsiella pneumoniae]
DAGCLETAKYKKQEHTPLHNFHPQSITISLPSYKSSHSLEMYKTQSHYKIANIADFYPLHKEFISSKQDPKTINERKLHRNRYI